MSNLKKSIKNGGNLNIYYFIRIICEKNSILKRGFFKINNKLRKKIQLDISIIQSWLKIK